MRAVKRADGEIVGVIREGSDKWMAQIDGAVIKSSVHI